MAHGSFALVGPYPRRQYILLYCSGKASNGPRSKGSRSLISFQKLDKNLGQKESRFAILWSLLPVVIRATLCTTMNAML
jgi:hypothetical protein